MKKLLSLVLVLIFAVTVVAGCGSSATSEKTTAPSSTAAQSSTAAESSAPAAAGDDAVKTGLAVISSIAKSADAGEKDGLAEVDSMIAAVTVDKDGKVVKCVIDAAQTKVNFSKEGKLLTDLKTVYKTKQELKEEYGMKGNSKISKEWYEQADGFAAYVVGKTADEIKGIAVNDQGVAADAELASTITVHIADFINVTVKAINNAKDAGAKAGDKLGLGVSTNIAKSTDAGEKDGLAQAYSNYTATTFGADGKITSCVINASQSNVNFSKEGKVTSDLKAELKDKVELGEAYGLKKASKIGKEWFEQVDAFAKYVTGKSVDEVKGIALNEGAPADAELTSSVTIHVTDYMDVIERASKAAK